MHLSLVVTSFGSSERARKMAFYCMIYPDSAVSSKIGSSQSTCRASISTLSFENRLVFDQTERELGCLWQMFFQATFLVSTATGGEGGEAGGDRMGVQMGGGTGQARGCRRLRKVADLEQEEALCLVNRVKQRR